MISVSFLRNILSIIALLVLLAVVGFLAGSRHESALVPVADYERQEEYSGAETDQPYPRTISIFQDGTSDEEVVDDTRHKQGRATFAQLFDSLVPESENLVVDESTESEFVDQTAEVRAYGNALGGVLLLYTDSVRENSAFTTAITNPSDAAFDELDTIAGQYAALAEGLRTLSVPSDQVRLHTTLQEAYQVHAQVVANIAALKSVGSISGEALMPLSESATALGQALIAMAASFRDQGIRFAANDPGYLFSLITP